MLRFFMIGRRRSKSPATYKKISGGGGAGGLDFSNSANSMYISIFPL